MPVKTVQRGGKWRVVEVATGKLATRNGRAVDGGGHQSKENAIDQGSSVLLYSADSDSIIGLDSLFDLKTSNYSIDNSDFLSYDFGVDHHLSDMLVLPACLINEMSVFTVKEITKHLETNLYVTSKITGCKYGVGKLTDGYEIRITGNSDTGV